MREKGFWKFVLEVVLVTAALVSVIVCCNVRRVFAGEEDNNHIRKKWHYLYQYAREKKPVDVLVIGNSHAYTGLRPEVLKDMAGLNCFLLAAPGVHQDDCSYMLEEALSILTPRMVILETYPIDGYVQKDLPPGQLSSQFDSFSNRRNLALKLKSMFRLFRLDDIPYAWSSTLRNHDILFDNWHLFKYNLRHPKAPEFDPSEDYWGRFIAFSKGLTEETLNKYRQDGPPVDGSRICPGPDAVKATRRMLALCEKKKIPVMFLTIPMYHQHIANAKDRHDNLAPLVGDNPWLDLQLPVYDSLFGPECFEDTYKQNQHQTGTGAIRSSYALSRFILRRAGLVE